jgi:hypothetical protein
VIAHPESTVRGRRLDEEGGIVDGYYLTGPTFCAGAGRDIALYRGLFLSLSAMLSGSFATVPIEGGEASVPNLALHGHLGLGYRF